MEDIFVLSSLESINRDLYISIKCEEVIFLCLKMQLNCIVHLIKIVSIHADNTIGTKRNQGERVKNIIHKPAVIQRPAFHMNCAFDIGLCNANRIRIYKIFNKFI